MPASSAFLLLFCAALFSISCGKTANVDAESTPVVDIPTVAVSKATSEDLSHDMTVTAEFKPFQEVDLMAKVAGYVKSIRVDVGDRVRQGELLATLEIPEMADDRTRAKAAIERAEAEVARARDELQRAQSAHQITHISYVRLSGVANAKPGLVAQQEIDDAHSKDLVSEAQVSAARSNLAAVQQQVLVNRADLTKINTLFELHPRYRTLRRRDYETIRRYRFHDPGWDRIADTGHAAGAAFRKQPAPPDPAGPRIGSADGAHGTAG